MKSMTSCSLLPQDTARPPGRSSQRKFWSRAFILGSLAAGLLAGCEADGIRDYKVPKQQAHGAKGGRPQEPRRLLAIIAPRGEQTWFFKLVGPTEVIKTQHKAFGSFLESLRYTGKEFKWTVPDGWKEEPGVGPRFATLRNTQGVPLEITVFVFGREAAKVMDNINRWRKLDLGLGPAGREELKKVVHELPIDGEPAFLVDMESEAEDAPAAPAPGPGEKIRYKTPKGWQKAPAGGPFRMLAVFVIKEGNQTARITVMPGVGGSLLMNVNRWREQQLRLPPIDEKQLSKDVRKIQVAGVEGDYVDLTAPGDDAGRQRILGVLVPHDGQQMAFKMMGPADLVGKQKAAFEEFVKSVKFGGRGGADE